MENVSEEIYYTAYYRHGKTAYGTAPGDVSAVSRSQAILLARERDEKGECATFNRCLRVINHETGEITTEILNRYPCDES